MCGVFMCVRVYVIACVYVSLSFVSLQFGPFSVPASSNLYFHFSVFDLISTRTTLASLRFCFRVFIYGDEAAKQRRLNNPVTLSPSAGLSFLVSQPSAVIPQLSFTSVISAFSAPFATPTTLFFFFFFSLVFLGNKEENY